jgi:hypothetical protein
MLQLEFIAAFQSENIPMELPRWLEIQVNHFVISQAIEETINDMKSLSEGATELEDNRNLQEKLENTLNNGSLEEQIKACIFSCLLQRLPETTIPIPSTATWDDLLHKIPVSGAFPGYAQHQNEINAFCRSIEKLTVKPKSKIPIDADHIENIKQIMFSHQTICSQLLTLKPFLLFRRQPLSTGEENMVQFLARFYSLKREAKSAPSILFLNDEGEANFHPEWQRRYVSLLVEWTERILKKWKCFPKIQVVLTTHSPFVACDLPRGNIVRLKRELGNSTKVDPAGIKRGIGANLLDLLSDDFFVKIPMGAYSKKKIDQIMQKIKDGKPMDANDDFVLQHLDDPFLKQMLLERKFQVTFRKAENEP